MVLYCGLRTGNSRTAYATTEPQQLFSPFPLPVTSVATGLYWSSGNRLPKAELGHAKAPPVCPRVPPSLPSFLLTLCFILPVLLLF